MPRELVVGVESVEKGHLRLDFADGSRMNFNLNDGAWDLLGMIVDEERKPEAEADYECICDCGCKNPTKGWQNHCLTCRDGTHLGRQADQQPKSEVPRG